MVKKEKYTVNRSIRLTETQANELDKLDVTLRDTVDFYIAHMKDQKTVLIDKKREIENKIKTMENEIQILKTELEQINNDLGFVSDNDNNLSMDLYYDAEAIVDAYKKDKAYSKRGISYFIGTNKYNKILNIRVEQHGGLNKEEYKKQLETMVLKYK